jgi:hypothetical protein
MKQDDIESWQEPQGNTIGTWHGKSAMQICGLLLVTVLVAWMAITWLSPNSDVASPAHSKTVVPPWAIRVVIIILALVGWHATQKLIGTKATGDPQKAASASMLLTNSDVLLQATEPANRFLNAHPKWANWLLTVSSAIIDQLGIYLLLSSVIGPTVQPFIGLLILFALRQVCQALTAMPPPIGMIWRDPGFPSIFVTYGVANDLFFSGHTALAVYAAIQLAQLGHSWLTATAVALVLFEIATVLVVRAHYTIDVFTGLIAALFVSGVAMRIAPACDRALLFYQN